jgi:hypothetical protein
MLTARYTDPVRIRVILSYGLVFCLAAAAIHGQSVAGLKWTAPAGWKVEGSRPMRAATYTVPAVAGDAENAECVVYFFGAGSGGSVEANMERWKSQILKADGKPADAQIVKRTVHALPVTIIDSTGTYTGTGGPLAPGATCQGAVPHDRRGDRESRRKLIPEVYGSGENRNPEPGEIRSTASILWKKLV